MNHGWQSEATDGPRAAKRKESAKRKKSADRSGKYFSTPETWTVERNCKRIFANIWFSQVWKHSSYTYAIPWCFKIWAWLRHEFLETAIPWWFTSKFWPRHELGMSLSFDCTVDIPWYPPASWKHATPTGGPHRLDDIVRNLRFEDLKSKHEKEDGQGIVQVTTHSRDMGNGVFVGFMRWPLVTTFFLHVLSRDPRNQTHWTIKKS